jgi:hypothetical protein
MPKKSHYAIDNGHGGARGVFTEWSVAHELTSGSAGEYHEGFSSLQGALNALIARGWSQDQVDLASANVDTNLAELSDSEEEEEAPAVAAPAPEADPRAELEQLRAENARMRAMMEQMAASFGTFGIANKKGVKKEDDDEP